MSNNEFVVDLGLNDQVADFAIEWLNDRIMEALSPSHVFTWPSSEVHPSVKSAEQWIDVLVIIRDGFLAHKMIMNNDYGLTDFERSQYENYMRLVDEDGTKQRVVTYDEYWDNVSGDSRWEFFKVWEGDGPEPEDNSKEDIEILEAYQQAGLELFAIWFPYLW